jgi:CBS domain-containing protein
LFTARETANATLEAARQTLRGLEEAADTLPVDADPRMAGLFAARETAKAALGAARQTLRALEGAVDAFPIDADPRMLGLFTAHETANAALEAARQTLRGLEGAVDTFPIDADPRMVGLFTARETANAGLEAANLVLEGVKQSVGALADVSEYIVEHGLGGLLDIRSASFEAGLNAAAGGRVSLQTELVFMGKEQEFAFQFNFENPLASAQDLSRLLLPT